MERILNETLNSTCDNTTESESCAEIDSTIIKQFKMIMIIVLIGLITFLGFFVYNLIKCYLPKWRGQLNKDQQPLPTSDPDNIKIEFETL